MKFSRLVLILILFVASTSSSRAEADHALSGLGQIFDAIFLVATLLFTFTFIAFMRCFSSTSEKRYRTSLIMSILSLIVGIILAVAFDRGFPALLIPIGMIITVLFIQKKKAKKNLPKV